VNKAVIIAIAGIILLCGFLLFGKLTTNYQLPTANRPTPTEEPLEQLPAEKQPKVSLDFSSDAHFVTVNIGNLYATSLEYNLIYEAVVKKTRIQTGVNASEKLDGQTSYSQRQLLGSESSGKFTYHTDIKNALMELTLRDDRGRSIFTATYPFEVTPGKSTELKSN
jgi:hypothetical protein